MIAESSQQTDRHETLRVQTRKLRAIFLLTSGFMVVELVGGWWSGSIALMADAGHMLSDSMAIALSWLAIWLSGREASAKRTFGYRRAEILAAFLNAMGLVVVAVWIVVEAVERLGSPQPVMGGVLLAVASGGLVVNLVGIGLLRPHAHGNLNIRAAIWHIAGDLLGSIGAIVAALVIFATGWTLIDPLVGIGIAVLVGVGGTRILYESTNILLDSVPKELDSGAVVEYLQSFPQVSAICDLHIWAVSSTEVVLTAHLVVEAKADRDSLLGELAGELKRRFGLAHITIQLEDSPQESCHPEW